MTPDKDSSSRPDQAPAPIARHARSVVAVFVQRSKATTPWETYVWRPLAVLPGAPATAPWTIIQQTEVTTQFFAGVVEIELYPRETGNYRRNLEADEPSVYVVLRRDAGSSVGIALAHVTVSPSEAEAYMDGEHIVERVAMPGMLGAWLADYVSANHVEEAFTKRQRQRYSPNKDLRGDHER